MNSLSKALIITLAAVIAAPATALAQRSNSGYQRYEEPSRFPLLRKAVRQVRSDIRYHTEVIRDTASDIKNDVRTSIRGELPRPAPNYGYRHDTATAPRGSTYEDFYQNRPQTTERRRTVNRQRPEREHHHIQQQDQRRRQ